MRPLKIVLAEDNQDHAELIIDTLKDFNVANDIMHFTDGEQLLSHLQAKAENGEPDLILLDLKMPRMDGLATLRAIRANEKTKTIPVIMVSTSTVEKEIKESYIQGANSYVTKPLQFEEFSRKIKDLNLYWVLTSEIPRGLDQ